MSDEYTQYLIDIAFCIDVTFSMDPYLENLKKLATEFHERLESVMALSEKGIGALRVRLITFGDIGDEGKKAIYSTRFFELPDQSTDFVAAVNSLEAEGGGDIPESALEALWVAMNSSWRKQGLRRRHIIFMATDATAHELGKYPYEIEQCEFKTPRNLTELQKRWGLMGSAESAIMDANARRLVLLAPELEPWTTIEHWDHSIFLPSAAGDGLSDRDVEEICGSIAASV